jgi:hypothetical protein
MDLDAIRERVDADAVAALAVVPVGERIEDGFSECGAGVFVAVDAVHPAQLDRMQDVAHEPGFGLVELAWHRPLDLLLEEALAHLRSGVPHDGDAGPWEEVLGVCAQEQDSGDRGDERTIGLASRAHQQFAGLQQGVGVHRGAGGEAPDVGLDARRVEIGARRARDGLPVVGKEAAATEQGADLLGGERTPM